MSGGRMAVVLLNLGGPESLADVRPFLYNLFSDRMIIRLGPAFLQKPIAWLIAKRRAPKTRSYYSQIGGGSPIVKLTNAQAAALEDSLKVDGECKVYVGMRYWKPSIEDAVARAVADGATRILALSLYPHYSIATSGSSERVFFDAVSRHKGISAAAVGPWYKYPLYIEALAEVIREGLSTMGSDAHVLFSAHSLPQSFIDEGDPYVEHIKATIDALARKIPMRSSLGYQSRSGPVKWLEPSSEEEIKRLGREGVRKLLVVPISFVSDHIETLYEIDILYKGIAEAAGMELDRTQSLNTRPLFIRALEGLATEALRKEGWL